MRNPSNIYTALIGSEAESIQGGPRCQALHAAGSGSPTGRIPGPTFIQFHWYDKFAIEEPFPWAPYAELGLDKPCLIGEVATASTEHTAEEYLQAACAGGYQGLLLWSYRAGDEFSSFARARAGLARWCASPGC